MIISLRGTNGSGKSTIVREIMRGYPRSIKIEYPGRRRPRGYLCQTGKVSDLRSLFVPGHYEIANGGVDTLSSLDEAYDLIERHAELGCHVLYEGKNMSDGVGRLLALRRAGYPVAVALIDEPVRKCVAAVRSRGHKIKRETIEKLHRKSHSQMATFQKEKIECFTGPRDQVLEQVRRWLKLT